MSSDPSLESSLLEPPKPQKLDHSPSSTQGLPSSNSISEKRRSFSSSNDPIQILPKSETFMQRKLRKIQEEVLQSFAGVDFAKSNSKAEKERPTIQVNDKRKSNNPFESPAPIKMAKLTDTPDNTAASPNTSDVSYLKVDDSINVTPFSTVVLSPSSHNKASSEKKDEGVTPDMKCSKKENLSAETDGKNRENVSAEKEGNVKANLNAKFEAKSFDEMMSNAKKKMPRIAEEKRLAKEREELKKKEELKMLNSKEMILKLDACEFNLKK